MNIMVTGAGSTMGQSVIKALLFSKYGKTVNLYVTNSEPLGAGFFITDRIKGKYIVPVAKDHTYIDVIIKICIEHKINGIFSGTEHEITTLSVAAEKIYNKTGAKVMLSRPEIVKMGTDKYKTFLFFKEHGLCFPKTALYKDYINFIHEVGGFPIFMKPRIASASRNTYVIRSEKELFEKKFDDDGKIILQEYLESDVEYTVEVFCDKSGKAVGVIPMKRNLEYGMSISGLIDHNEDVIAECKKIGEKIKPDGALNIQLKIVNGKVIPFEVNTRFSSTECVRAHYGFNAVEAAIDHYILNMPVELNKWRTGMFMRYWEECYFDEVDIPI